MLCCAQGRTREQLAAANVEAEACRSQLEVSNAKLQRLERSNAQLRKQRAQMMADLQVLVPLPAGPLLALPLQYPTCCPPAVPLPAGPLPASPLPVVPRLLFYACCTPASLPCLLHP